MKRECILTPYIIVCREAEIRDGPFSPGAGRSGLHEAVPGKIGNQYVGVSDDVGAIIEMPARLGRNSEYASQLRMNKRSTSARVMPRRGLPGRLASVERSFELLFDSCFVRSCLASVYRAVPVSWDPALTTGGCALSQCRFPPWPQNADSATMPCS